MSEMALVENIFLVPRDSPAQGTLKDMPLIMEYYYANILHQKCFLPNGIAAKNFLGGGWSSGHVSLLYVV
ncbi:hypothetical protein DSO57_1029107 [Entomophthora muscae]|uniref:Uncharacterized protein n=1 Tax=Entomophthora muscae TaxID=34485 RepID=A0ACC2TNA3_9FUNG|nr:hypothetical protein DSO57_1029107 [Entomophthora muscae]